MDSLDVISIDRSEEPDPWPGILRLIALVALLFAAGQILLDEPAIQGYFSQGHFSRSTSRALFVRRWQIASNLRVGLAVMDMMDCGLMFVGALLLLKYRDFLLPVQLAAWAW